MKKNLHIALYIDFRTKIDQRSEISYTIFLQILNVSTKVWTNGKKMLSVNIIDNAAKLKQKYGITRTGAMP